MEEDITMNLTIPYTNEYLGSLIPRDTSPRISVKEKTDESSDVLIWKISPYSAPLDWDYRWLEPAQKDIVPNSWELLRDRLTNPLYGREILNEQLDELAVSAPGISQVWKITESWPSLTKLLLEDRNNE